jgi:hypothetical protein
MKIIWTAVMKAKALMKRARTPVVAVVLWNLCLLHFKVGILKLSLTAEHLLLISHCIAQATQKTSSRKAVFLTKMKAMCEEYKLDATQSLEDVHRYL